MKQAKQQTAQTHNMAKNRYRSQRSNFHRPTFAFQAANWLTDAVLLE
jgi:hypothetical protein